jgi:hypothetical protein
VFTFLACVGLLPVLPGVGALAAREIVRDLAGADCDDGVRALLTIAASGTFGLVLMFGTFAIPSFEFPALLAILAVAVVAAMGVTKWFLGVVGA